MSFEKNSKQVEDAQINKCFFYENYIETLRDCGVEILRDSVKIYRCGHSLSLSGTPSTV